MATTELTGEPEQIASARPARIRILSAVHAKAEVARQKLAGSAPALALLESLLSEIEGHSEAQWWLAQPDNATEVLSQTLKTRKRPGGFQSSARDAYLAVWGAIV